jgi:hypothetical protein
VKELSVKMDVGLEADSGRAVELAHNNALGTIDDKSARLGHERDLAHIDLLFLRGFLVLVAEGNVKRSAVSLTLDLTLDRTDLRLLEGVAHEIKGGLLFKSKDWEELAKNGLKADILALGGFHAGLEKFFVGPDLQFDEVRRLNGLVEFAEVDAFRHGAGSWVALG